MRVLLRDKGDECLVAVEANSVYYYDDGEQDDCVVIDSPGDSNWVCHDRKCIDQATSFVKAVARDGYVDLSEYLWEQEEEDSAGDN